MSCPHSKPADIVVFSVYSSVFQTFQAQPRLVEGLSRLNHLVIGRKSQFALALHLPVALPGKLMGIPGLVELEHRIGTGLDFE
jgi:hypothetical protein